MEVKDWDSELADLQTVISEMEIRHVQESVLEEDREIYGRIKAEVLSKSIENEKIRKVEPKKDVEIKYFMDGIQRTTLIGWVKSRKYITYAPVHLHLSGVVILAYKEGQMLDAVYGPTYNLKILIPSLKILDKTFVDNYGSKLEESVMIGKKSWDIRELRRKAWLKSSDLRQALEMGSLLSFNQSSDSYTAVDGTLPLHPQILERNNLIGIVKSHRKQYLRRRDEMKVLDMAGGMRSWIFEISKTGGLLPKEHVVHSVYLRINDYYPDPFHGLTRLEFNPALDDEIDDLCSIIYQLREPIAPSQNWDRKIYPIYLCEKYLEANSISITSLKEIFS